MNSFTAAPGEMDYDDERQGQHAIERQCWDCRRPVWVNPREDYAVQVFCDRCATRDLHQLPSGPHGCCHEYASKVEHHGETACRCGVCGYEWTVPSEDARVDTPVAPDSIPASADGDTGVSLHPKEDWNR